jgi:hypothetical protein
VLKYPFSVSQYLPIHIFVLQNPLIGSSLFFTFPFSYSTYPSSSLRVHKGMLMLKAWFFALRCCIAVFGFVLLLCVAAPPLRDNNAHIRDASPITNIEILLAPVLEFIEYIINIDFLLRFESRSSLSDPLMQEIPRLKLRPHNNPLPKAFRIWPPCTTRSFGASSGLQRSASELYCCISPGSLDSSDLGVAPRHTRSAGLTIWDCQSLSYDNTNRTITLS